MDTRDTPDHLGATVLRRAVAKLVVMPGPVAPRAELQLRKVRPSNHLVVTVVVPDRLDRIPGTRVR
jgi:hypothetical protein